MFVMMTSVSEEDRDKMDICLNQLIQFCSNKRDKSSPLNFTQYALLPHNIEIVMWPQITVSSLQWLHPMYNNDNVIARNSSDIVFRLIPHTIIRCSHAVRWSGRGQAISYLLFICPQLLFLYSSVFHSAATERHACVLRVNSFSAEVSAASR